MIYSFKGHRPIIHPTAFVHPQAAVTGQVIIGEYCYIGPGAALRGDFGKIIIGNGCNVQENCTIHMFPGVAVILEDNAHIGHGAIIHGSHIGKNCMVAMNAVVMDEVILGNECIVGALSFVKAGEQYEDRSLIIGNPAKKIKEVTDDMIAWKTKGTEIYQQLARDMKLEWAACEPLQEPTGTETEQDALNYKTWIQQKKK